MSKIGICPACDRSAKTLEYRHPETGQIVCYSCYQEAIRKISLKKKQEARREMSLKKKGIQRRRPIGVKRVNEPARLAQIPAIAPSLATVGAGGSNKSIREEKENVKEPERKEKYPNRKSVIAALEDRETQGKENFSDILNIDDIPLYQAVLEFEVELPKKEDFPVRYYPKDLVKNQNLKDPDICGKIGWVVRSSEKEVVVDFREVTRIVRVYQKWYNLNNIILHARNLRSLAEIAKREASRLGKKSGLLILNLKFWLDFFYFF